MVPHCSTSHSRHCAEQSVPCREAPWPSHQARCRTGWALRGTSRLGIFVPMSFHILLAPLCSLELTKHGPIDAPYSVPPVSKACRGMMPSVVPGMADSTGR
jgi:hypothetical protein